MFRLGWERCWRFSVWLRNDIRLFLIARAPSLTHSNIQSTGIIKPTGCEDTSAIVWLCSLGLNIVGIGELKHAAWTRKQSRVSSQLNEHNDGLIVMMWCGKTDHRRSYQLGKNCWFLYYFFLFLNLHSTLCSLFFILSHLFSSVSHCFICLFLISLISLACAVFIWLFSL